MNRFAVPFAVAALVLLASCGGTDFGETPRLEEITRLAETDPDPDWQYSLLQEYPEANLLVHVELCGRDGTEIHEAAMAEHYTDVSDTGAGEKWLHGYVTTIRMVELQVRYNLASGSISSKSAVCGRTMEALKAWRESGELPTRLL